MKMYVKKEYNIEKYCSPKPNFVPHYIPKPFLLNFLVIKSIPRRVSKLVESFTQIDCDPSNQLIPQKKHIHLYSYFKHLEN